MFFKLLRKFSIPSVYKKQEARNEFFHKVIAHASARRNNSRVFSEERLSLAEPLLLENSSPNCFLIHLLQSARCVFGGAAPVPLQAF